MRTQKEMLKQINSVTNNVYWQVSGGGRFITDPPLTIKISRSGQPPRYYKNIKSDSLNRLIALSEGYSVEVIDSQIELSGLIKR